MPSLNPARQNILILVILLLAQLLMMSSNVRRPAGETLLERFFHGLTRPVIAAAGAVGGGVRGAFRSVGEIRAARSENRRLAAELAQLREELRKRDEAALQNERLQRLLAMREAVAVPSVGARVLTSELTEREQVIVVDRGSEEGVRPDQPVVAWGGAVGRVVTAGRHTARVRLLSDPESRVAGIVQRSREGGSLHGRAFDDLHMVYVAGFADVREGDAVLTSGLGGIFPSGFRIGRVEEVVATGIAKEIRVSPPIEYHRLEEVLILMPPVEAVEGSAP